MGLDQVMTRCREHLVDRWVEDMEVGHALTLVSDDVHEGLPVWSSKPGIDGLLVWAS